MSDILKKILARKAEEIRERSGRVSLRELSARVDAAPPVRGFVAALETKIAAGHAGVIAEVKRLAGLFPTGLIISPSHEAILSDTPPANVEAIFTGVHSL